jgi:hypothetical protein
MRVLHGPLLESAADGKGFQNSTLAAGVNYLLIGRKHHGADISFKLDRRRSLTQWV